jgi:hypothetical protein
LRAPAIQKLLAAGSLQLSLFDQRDLAEIADAAYPGERLVVCRNPMLAEERARKREELAAEETGAAIGRTLREQSRLLRLENRRTNEEAAARVPVKLLFPLIIFILPAAFVVALGPALVQVFETLTRF